MRLVTPKEMAKIDLKVQRRYGVPSILLMENAARGVVDTLEEYFELTGLKVLVVCGIGNNGGDGFAAARHLKIRGSDARTFLVGSRNRLKGDTLLNGRITGIDYSKNLKKVIDDFHPDVIIDAIFGTGFKGRPKSIYKSAIEVINGSDSFIVAVDIPSGVNGYTGVVEDSAVFADVTVAMCLPKTGLLLYPGRYCCGDLWITDIGITDEMIGPGKTNLLDDEEISSIIPARPAEGHKGVFGKVLVLAGSRGYSGAACLTANGALRTGAGLVILGVPEGLIDTVEEKLTEVVKFSLPETDTISFSKAGVKDTILRSRDSDVLVIGPGISTNPETKEFLYQIISKVKVPIVIDADGINNLTQYPDILKKSKSEIVLTPHPGELSRLIGIPPEEINLNRIELARKYAKKFGVVLVIKGVPSVISNKGGEVWVNPTGNSGLASGGSGDVLSGMIGGLIAQGVDPFDASKAGVYLHGLAADLAVQDQNEYSLIASDILEFIGPAIDEVTKEYPE
ncbi:MAG TPA: NAD(P)H-hydrate dehydratase [bacterium (Candidatus Stahlbacteria)]|nr:NAD(P)H-hydrate dehydratase [Candidatus Stahlbacteria bacterium]